MSLPKKFFFIRHAESILNSKNYVNGVTDSNLSYNGLLDTIKIKRKFKNLKISKVYCSTLLRSIKTAKILFENKIDIEKLKNFSERNWGIYEKRHKKYIKKFNMQAPLGEKYSEFKNRIIFGIENYNFEENCLFCLHKGVLRIFLKKCNINLKSIHLDNLRLLYFTKKSCKSYDIKIII